MPEGVLASVCSTSAGPTETLRVKVLTVLAAPAAPAPAPAFLLSAGCHDGLLQSGTRARWHKSPLRKAGEHSAPVANGVRRRIVISVVVYGSLSLVVVPLTLKADAIRNAAESKTTPEMLLPKWLVIKLNQIPKKDERTREKGTKPSRPSRGSQRAEQSSVKHRGNPNKAGPCVLGIGVNECGGRSRHSPAI